MRLTKQSFPLFFLASAAVLLLLEYRVVATGAVGQSQLVALAVTFDLAFGLPLLWYLLVVRPLRLAPISLAPVFVLALFVAGLILPAASQGYLDLLRNLLPLLELLILGFVGHKLWQARRGFQAADSALYLTERIEAATRLVIGNARVAAILATELALLVLALSGWALRFRPLRADLQVFSTHRSGSYHFLLALMLPVLAVETIGLHLIVAHWNATLAWILSVLSIYAALWLIGDYQAVRLHPLLVDGGTLHLRAGLRWQATLPLRSIAAIRRLRPHDPRDRHYLSLAPAGEPRLVLELYEPVQVRGLFGVTRQVTRLGLAIDDEAGFRAAVAAAKLNG